MSEQETAPDFIEPIEKFRSWLFDGTRIRSMNGTEWTPGEPLKASCIIYPQIMWQEHQHGSVPFEPCGCGIYAVDSPKQAIYGGSVFGTVKMWGKIIPGTKGVRAEYAYPSHFWVANPELLDNPSLQAYGVPIDHVSKLEIIPPAFTNLPNVAQLNAVSAQLKQIEKRNQTVVLVAMVLWLFCVLALTARMFIDW